MLQEISSTHRINHHKPKRWFTDSDMDLFIWFKNQRPICFQLSYNKRQHEHSIGWHVDAGFSHSLIKFENRHSKYQPPGTASPESEHDFKPYLIAREFLLASNCIETTLADFIFARLVEYPGQLDIRSNRTPVAKSL